MIGAIIGDIAGSVYEFDNTSVSDFDLLAESSFSTDDTVLTVAAIIEEFYAMIDKGNKDK